MNICQPYLQACEIYLEQSQLVVQPHPGCEILVEVDEEDQEEARGMSTSGFRGFVEDVYLQTYMLICNFYKEGGVKKFFEMLNTKLEAAQHNILAIESCLFLLKSIECALKDDPHPSTLQYVKGVFDSLLSPTKPFLAQFQAPRNLQLKRGFCHLVKEMASFFSNFPQHLGMAL